MQLETVTHLQQLKDKLRELKSKKVMLELSIRNIEFAIGYIESEQEKDFSENTIANIDNQ